MYLFYVDESGDPNSFTKGQRNFVLGGVAIHEGQIRTFTEALDNVQKHFFPTIQFRLELHASEINAGVDRFRIGRERQDAFLDAVYSVIEDAWFPNLIVFITAIHESAVETPRQVLRACLEDICERFNLFLVRQYKAGFKDKGLLIMDQSGRTQRVRECMDEFERHGTTHGYLGNIVDVPYFGDSEHTRMLQLADLVAWAGGRYFNKSDDTYLNKIWDRLDRVENTDRLVGLKHITGDTYHCQCRACRTQT